MKSASDDNEYRAVTLSNGIRCVVVSDRSTELAAVEIRVGWCCPKLIFIILSRLVVVSEVVIGAHCKFVSN